MTKSYLDVSDIKSNIGEKEFSFHVLSKEEVKVMHKALKAFVKTPSPEPLTEQHMALDLIKAIENCYAVPHTIPELIPAEEKLFK